MDSDSEIIRFDEGPVEFNPADFSLTYPKPFKSVAYKPITSQLRYKNNNGCTILFPAQSGYGLSELKNDKGELLNYSTPYYKKDETPEEKNFNSWVEKLEAWIQTTVLQFAHEEVERAKKKQAVVIIQKDAEKIKKETIKPLFVYPKDETTGMVDEEKMLRHYLKFKVDANKNLKADVFNYKEEELDSSEVITTRGLKGQEDTLRKGEYLYLAKIKGVFYGAHGKSDYVVSIQTEGHSICYKKAGKTSARSLLGNRSEKNLTSFERRSEGSRGEDTKEDFDDDAETPFPETEPPEPEMEEDDVQAAMRKKLEDRLKKL